MFPSWVEQVEMICARGKVAHFFTFQFQFLLLVIRDSSYKYRSELLRKCKYYWFLNIFVESISTLWWTCAPCPLPSAKIKRKVWFGSLVAEACYTLSYKGGWQVLPWLFWGQWVWSTTNAQPDLRPQFLAYLAKLCKQRLVTNPSQFLCFLLLQLA